MHVEDEVTEDIEKIWRRVKEGSGLTGGKIRVQYNLVNGKYDVALYKRNGNEKYGAKRGMTKEIMQYQYYDLVTRQLEELARDMVEYEVSEFGDTISFKDREITIFSDTKVIRARCEECKYRYVIDLSDCAAQFEDTVYQILLLYVAGEMEEVCPCAIHRKSKHLNTISPIV